MTGIRRILERASRNVRLVRRLPARFGRTPLHVSPGAALCYYRRLDGPVWRDLYEFAARYVRPGTTVWDIGANMGVFAFAAAHVSGSGGQVLAVEADTWSVELLKKSARHRQPHAARVEVLSAAVGERQCLQEFVVVERGRSGSHLSSAAGAGASLLGSARETHPVVTVSLDWLQEQHGAPSAIKLDVEGAELAALSGASRVLAEARPAVFLEVYERNADAMTALLQDHGYRLWDISAGWEAPRPMQRAAYNTLALPA